MKRVYRVKHTLETLPLVRMTRGGKIAGATGYSAMLNLICCNIKNDLPTIPFSYRENRRKAFLKFLGVRRLLKFNLYLSFYVNSRKDEVIHVSQKVKRLGLILSLTHLGFTGTIHR